MKKLMILLLMLVGTVNAALPTNVGTNFARAAGYSQECKDYSIMGYFQMESLLDAFGVQEVLSDKEFQREVATINELFIKEGSVTGCAVLKLLLREVGLYSTFFE